MLNRLMHLMFAASLLLAASPAIAAVPSTLSYQGLLSDGGGAPVPTGAYDLHFALYDVASGGAPLWSESHPGVGVVNGSFAVTLGSVNPLAGVAFDGPRWLGIRVGSQPELVPRIELAATPYALALRAPFRMASSDTTPALTLGNTAGYRSLRLDAWMDLTNPDYGGYARFQQAPGGDGVIVHGGTGLPGYRSGIEVWMPPAENGIACLLRGMHGQPRAGELYVAGNVNGRRAWLRGTHTPTQSPHFEMVGAASSFVVNTGLIDDAAVELPWNSVGPMELFGGPGFSNTEGAAVTVGATMGEIAATTITTPTAGYIVVTAESEVRLSGTTGANTVTYQISTSATGPEEPAVVRVVGAHQFVSTVFHFMTASAKRVYLLAAGTHTFRLIGRRDGAGTAVFQNPSITAVFLARSFGSVVSSAGSGPPAELSRSEASGPVRAAADVDLAPAARPRDDVEGR